MTGWIKKRVEFIAPVIIVPGENELESLAMGTLRVLKGQETAREYDLD
jgi:butyrate kinase